MGLDLYKVPRDHFAESDGGMFAFPCSACKHRYGEDTDEPCIRCDWNLRAKSDDELLHIEKNKAAERDAKCESA